MEKRFQSFVRRVTAEGLPVEGISAYVEDKPLFAHRFTPDTPRNIYSHTKSFMSTAVGIAVSDGLLSLADRPADFFPEAVSAETDARAREITLRDCLMMASGFCEALLMADKRRAGEGAPDYARYILSHPVKKAPGTAFCYSNGDSYLAGRMVEHVTGKALADFVEERLFAPLSISRPTWEACPMGHTFGASGLLLPLEDMMKLGRLYLGGGLWNGASIVDPAWIREATAHQIATPDSPENSWHCGYGYQFWLLPYKGAYRADGAFGQITMVLPEKGMVVGVQCTESEHTEKVRIALDEEILSA